MDSDTHKDISVVFLGSGPVAAESLRLVAQSFAIEAVITKPRPEHHKGSVPVLELCAGADAPTANVITVSNKAELSEAVQAHQFTSQLGVVIDFGIIISQDVIDAFPLGIINSHFSLLPEWRGADPITFSVLSGQKQTGVSLMLITAGLDEGPLLAQIPYDLPDDITTPQLTAELVKISAASLPEVLPLYVSGQASPAPQEDVTMAARRTPTFSRKLTKDDGVLDFQKPAIQLEREVRAFIGWPGSRTTLGDRDIVITATHIIQPAEPGEPGAIWHDGKQFGFYTASDTGGSGSVLVIDRLKPAGKPEMTTEAFLAGNKLS